MKLLKKFIEPAIEIVFQNFNLDYNEHQQLIQIPRDSNVCDLCIPCFSLAKIIGENQKIPNSFVKKTFIKFLKFSIKKLIKLVSLPM